jgi:hypothetical protein
MFPDAHINRLVDSYSYSLNLQMLMQLDERGIFALSGWRKTCCESHGWYTYERSYVYTIVRHMRKLRDVDANE